MNEETILIVDDGQDNREFLVKYVLEPNGFQALTARDGQEGLETALRHHPDLILLDLQMPRMTGIQVLEALAAQNADIPVILMTFHGSEDIAVEVYRLGVKDYVKKPFTPEEMLDAIERSLSETRLRREKESLTQRILQANMELQRHLQELNILYNVGKSVTSTTDISRLLPRIVDAATQITHAEEGFIHLIEDKKLIARAHKRLNHSSAQATQTEVRDPIAVHVLKNRQPIALAHEQLEAFLGAGGPTSAAYAPLILNERLMGVLGVANVTRNTAIFSLHDGALLSALSDYAAIAIENSRNYDALRISEARVRDKFEQFVAPAVVNQALSKDEIKLGGTRQEVSILFADIRGYSTWSENVDPEIVLDTLNHYLSLAAEVILGWDGTLDKFMGDGLMAIFNAPIEQENHAHRAADAALALIRAAQEVNLMHGHQLSYSIGVHVGDAVVGYLGTQRALNYTAIGDVVNLAKRLQESAKPGQILISDAIFDRLDGRIHANQVGEIKVKGRKNTALAYELIDLR